LAPKYIWIFPDHFVLEESVTKVFFFSFVRRKQCYWWDGSGFYIASHKWKLWRMKMYILSETI